MKLTLPTDSAVRKDIPLYSGCYTYFPAALAGVAIHSKLGNDKHNPGEPLHHARGKSMDHADCIARHSMDIADFMAHRVVWTQEEQDAILAEANALCWRALALSQELHEKFGAPLAPAARLPKQEPADAVQEDFLGRRIREYYPAGRLHRAWCGLDSDHSGDCTPIICGEKSPEAIRTDYRQAVEKPRQYAHADAARPTSKPGSAPVCEPDPRTTDAPPYRP